MNVTGNVHGGKLAIPHGAVKGPVAHRETPLFSQLPAGSADPRQRHPGTANRPQRGPGGRPCPVTVEERA
ncbi:hypothetical protein Asera_15440 [Actinocatenispora sera]|uniref:Uncharacterized protein n=1 Tax=Actinocatenispora sera TaxID=390989 RepID=A0A810KYN6_9ACTN|nr:hypothetical protein Asera_15440 [Actinocatenispora sera]